jgi:hypothetical protein
MANTVPGSASRGAPTLALLFAGMAAGVLVGLVALLPSTIARPPAQLTFDEAPRAAAVPAPAALPVPPAAEAPPSLLRGSAPAAAMKGPTPVVELATRAIGYDQTLVTFVPVADGERVLVDGRAVTSADPTKMRCGKHTIRIGAGAKRRVSFPCGGVLTMD